MEEAADICATFNAPDHKTAEAFLQAAIQKYVVSTKLLSAWLEENLADGFTIFIEMVDDAVNNRENSRRMNRGANRFDGAPFSSAREVRMGKENEGTGQDEMLVDAIDITGGTIETLEADVVSVTQGGANQITASDIELRQGGALQVQGERVTLDHAAAGTVRGDLISATDGGIGVAVGEDVKLYNAQVGAVVGRKIDADNSSSVILLAQEVNGTVETMLDTRGALLAGVVSGITIGLLLIVGRLFTRRR